MRPALRLRGRARYPTSPKPLWWEAGAARAPHELIFWSTVRWSSVDVLHYRPQSMTRRTAREHTLVSLASTTSTRLSAEEIFISKRISSRSGQSAFAPHFSRLAPAEQKTLTRKSNRDRRTERPASGAALAGKSAFRICKQNTKWDELLCSRQARLNPIIVVCQSLETNFVGSSNEGNRSSITLQRIGTLGSRDRSTIPAHRCRVAGRRSRPGRSRPGRSSQAGGCDLRLAPVILRCAPSPSSSSWLFGGLGPLMQT